MEFSSRFSRILVTSRHHLLSFETGMMRASTSKYLANFLPRQLPPAQKTYSRATWAFAPINTLGFVVSFPTNYHRSEHAVRGTLRLTTFNPTTFHRESTEVNCLGRPRRRSPNRSFSLWHTPKVRDHANTTLMNGHHRGVFICISKILGQILRNQFILQSITTPPPKGLCTASGS